MEKMKKIISKIIFMMMIMITSANQIDVENEKIEIHEKLSVQHFDCNQKLNPQKYAINHIPNCEIEEKAEITHPAKIFIYEKIPQQKIAGYQCEIQYTYDDFRCARLKFQRYELYEFTMKKSVTITIEECLRAARSIEISEKCTAQQITQRDKSCSPIMLFTLDGQNLAITIRKFN